VTGRADRIPLPEWRYLPGINDRHEDNAFDDVKALCPERTHDGNASDNIAWQYGIRLLNEGYYWESHEVLEEVWRRALPNSRERFLVQSVIHLANGGLKRRLGRTNAVARLVAMAEECLERACSRCGKPVMGIDMKAMRQDCRRLASGDCLKPLLLNYAL
jgi:uncharacterized protein